MVIYIILFLLTLFLSNIIDKCGNKKKKYFYLFILLFLLSFVAGIRSIELGWDARKYVVSTYYRLEHFHGQFMQFMKATTVESGFSIYLLRVSIARYTSSGGAIKATLSQ